MPTSLHHIQAILMDWMFRYHDLALSLERHGPASDKMLHMNGGLILWLATVLVRGRRWGDFRNLWPAAICEGLNELADWLFPYKWTLSRTLADIAWTLFWPALLAWAIGGGNGGGKRRRA